MQLFVEILILFGLGACIGSFLNVLIYRTDKGEDWVRGRSHCENCGKLIHWYDNIPLLSYLMLRGKCRNCKKPIAKAHPIVEGLIGVLFVWWWLLGSLFFRLTEEPFVFVQPLFWLIVGVLLVYILVEDFTSQMISLWAMITLAVLAVLYRFGLVLFGVMQVQDLLSTYIAAFLITAFFYLLHVVTKGRGMGLGDVILAFPIVILVGWPRAIVWLFLSFLLGALVGVVLLIIGKAKFRQHIAFGPFMVAATLITLIWGEAIWQWYSKFL